MPASREDGLIDVSSAALLCVAAGIVDAVGYVQSGLFAANMTGNTVLAGIALARSDWPHAIDGGLALAWFFGGAMLGRILWDVGGKRATLPLFVEAAVLAACALVEAHTRLSLGLIAMAMGIQAAAIAKFAGMVLSTVVVTSTLVRLAEANLDFLVRLFGRGLSKERAPVVLLVMTWIAYGAGAVIAILLVTGAYAVILSALLVLVVLGIRRGRG
jgi:uncharacterized membrane protein YoaK (UPF0700 family)